MSKEIEGFTPPHPSQYGDPAFERIEVTDDHIFATLSDGRTISIPTWWIPGLLEADQEQRDEWEITGSGRSVYWEWLDDGLSVGSFFHGSPAPGARKHEPA